MSFHFGTFVLCVNVLWFGLAFRFFAIRAKRTVNLLVPRESKDEVSRRSLVDALPFLGGMRTAPHRDHPDRRIMNTQIGAS